MANIYAMADTWDDAGTTFTGIGLNVTDTASDASSLLMDLQVGGASKFSVTKDGAAQAQGTSIFSSIRHGNSRYVLNGGDGSIGSNTTISAGSAFSLGSRAFASSDVILARDAANTLAQRNSTNAQAFNLYNTYTDASNYERASFTQTATGLVLDSQYAGTGTEPDNILELKSGGTSRFSVSKTGFLNTNGINLSNNKSLQFDSVGYRFLRNTAQDAGVIQIVTNGSAWGGFRVEGFVTSRPILFSSSGYLSANVDLRLYRDAAGTLAQRNGINSQESRLYGTYTSATAYQRLSTKTIKEAVTAASGASVTTTISIPKYSQLIGVTTRVTTDLGNSNGTTGYTVGDGSDADLWGDITGITAGTTSDAADFTAVAALGAGTADRTITLTATGGNFDGTGVIEVCAFYLRAEAD